MALNLFRPIPASEEMRALERQITGTDPPVAFYVPMPAGTIEQARDLADFFRTMPDVSSAEAGHNIPLDAHFEDSMKCIGITGRFRKGAITAADAAGRVELYKILWWNGILEAQKSEG